MHCFAELERIFKNIKLSSIFYIWKLWDRKGFSGPSLPAHLRETQALKQVSWLFKVLHTLPSPTSYQTPCILFPSLKQPSSLPHWILPIIQSQAWLLVSRHTSPHWCQLLLNRCKSQLFLSISLLSNIRHSKCLARGSPPTQFVTMPFTPNPATTSS